jgi:hypothetical protein
MQHGARGVVLLLLLVTGECCCLGGEGRGCRCCCKQGQAQHGGLGQVLLLLLARRHQLVVRLVNCKHTILQCDLNAAQLLLLLLLSHAVQLLSEHNKDQMLPTAAAASLR